MLLQIWRWTYFQHSIFIFFAYIPRSRNGGSIFNFLRGAYAVYRSGCTSTHSHLRCAAAAAKSLQSCPTLCDPIDGSPPGSPVPGILQARTLEWVAISFSNAWKWKEKVKSLSRSWLLATPWTAAYQAPPSMGFARQEYWSGVPSPSPIYGAHRFPFLYILARDCYLFDNSHSNRHEVIIHCYFDWYFSNDSDFSTFLCTFWPFVYRLWKNDYSGLLPIFKIGLFLGLLLSSVYVLDINLLSDSWSATMFSHSFGCLFFFFLIDHIFCSADPFILM